MMPEVTFVTGNEKKWTELQAILGDGVLLKRAALDLPETQGSIEEVAKNKCREAARLVNGAVLTEDTALGFDALKGLPGPYVKWFLEALGLEGLIKLLSGWEDKAAKAICTVAYSSGPDAEPILFQGITSGRITDEPRGPRNFGWDPIFEPDHPSGLTYAEMPMEDKNKISHRYKALDLLKIYFNKLQ